jgi:crotonobetainyl-CoA:carnitine CoA-transferase CaiB-like acyl-CoA transferase
MSAQSNAGPLAGLRVIELAHVMAGPTCGRLLADMGADVIKLERPGGEDVRRMAPPYLGADAAAFVMMNRNKKDICLDLKAPAGLRAFLALADCADIIIENFRKGAMERLGLGYDTLSQRNPGLIYCEISGYGRTGPMAEEGGYDLMAQAASGLMSITGEGPGRPPIKVGAPVADIGAGLLATIGVLAALEERRRSGLGQRVDTSLFEAGIFQTLWQSAIHLATGATPQPMGSAHPLDAPYQAFEAANGWLVVGAANQANWLRLLRAIDRSDLQADPRFASNPDRMNHLAALVEDLAPVFGAHPVAHWLSLLKEHGVPAAPIASIAEMARDPQTLARRMIVSCAHPDLGEVATLGLPIKFSRTPGGMRSGAPRLGQHTRETLRAVGLDDATIEAAIMEAAASPRAEH